jgi:hypothetical protein
MHTQVRSAAPSFVWCAGTAQQSGITIDKRGGSTRVGELSTNGEDRLEVQAVQAVVIGLYTSFPGLIRYLWLSLL